MNSEQMLAQIREANITYLMLAQNIIRADRCEALFRLGLPEEAAELIASLSPAQISRIASTNMLLCRFRVDDHAVWNLLANHGAGKADSRPGSGPDNGAATKLHASILMAGRFGEAL